MKAATTALKAEREHYKISIHAAREGGDGMRAVTYTHRPKISIHAAREGGDKNLCATRRQSYISIHAAREGGDSIVFSRTPNLKNFNPRRP